MLLDDIKSISAGSDYSLFVSDKDDIFFSGVNHLFTSSCDDKMCVNKPTKVDIVMHHPLSIKDIQCGDGYILILTKEGNVYSLRRMNHTHTHSVISLTDKVKQIVVCNNYSFALTDRSDVYVWDYNINSSSPNSHSVSNLSNTSIYHVTPQKMIHIHNVRSLYSNNDYVCMSTNDRGIYYVSTSMNNHSTPHMDHIHTSPALTLVKDTSTGTLLYNSNIERNILDEYRHSSVCDVCCSDSCTLLLLRRTSTQCEC